MAANQLPAPQETHVCLTGEPSPVEVLRAADGHQAERVGQLGEAADLVVFLERCSHGHGAGEEGGASDPGTARVVSNKHTGTWELLVTTSEKQFVNQMS